MTPAASPRHPWKALAAVIAMFAVVHGARAHIEGARPHDVVRVVVGHPDAAAFDAGCADEDRDDDDDFDDDDDPLPGLDLDGLV